MNAVYFKDPKDRSLSPVSMVFVDFDGVILESNEPKSRAIREVLQAFVPSPERAIAIYDANPSLTRHQLIDVVFRQLLMTEPTPERVQPVTEMMNETIHTNVLNSKEVPGAVDFLARYSQWVPIHVVSATPVEQLRRVLEERGFDRYFAGVHGVPPSKAVIMEGILAQGNTPAARAIFIGDSAADHASAREAGIRFIGRDSGSPLGGHPRAVIADFCSIADVLPSEHGATIGIPG